MLPLGPLRGWISREFDSEGPIHAIAKETSACLDMIKVLWGPFLDIPSLVRALEQSMIKSPL